jgi:Mn-dependent DtxR family transcriptional regulator
MVLRTGDKSAEFEGSVEEISRLYLLFLFEKEVKPLATPEGDSPSIKLELDKQFFIDDGKIGFGNGRAKSKIGRPKGTMLARKPGEQKDFSSLKQGFLKILGKRKASVQLKEIAKELGVKMPQNLSAVVRELKRDKLIREDGLGYVLAEEPVEEEEVSDPYLEKLSEMIIELLHSGKFMSEKKLAQETGESEEVVARVLTKLSGKHVVRHTAWGYGLVKRPLKMRIESNEEEKLSV